MVKNKQKNKNTPCLQTDTSGELFNSTKTKDLIVSSG